MPKLWTAAQRGISRPAPACVAIEPAQARAGAPRKPRATGTSRPRTSWRGRRSRRRWSTLAQGAGARHLSPLSDCLPVQPAVQGRPEQAPDYDDRQDHAPAPAGLARAEASASTHGKEDDPQRELRVWLRLRARVRGASLRLQRGATSASASSRPRSSSASSTRASARRSSTTSSTSPSAARSPSPAPRLGEHINENWEDLVGPSNRSLVHWIRRLVFRGAWLDQRVKEGELDVVFDERTQTFGYVQPDRSSELIELSKEPSWRRIAYRR